MNQVIMNDECLWFLKNFHNNALNVNSIIMSNKFICKFDLSNPFLKLCQFLFKMIYISVFRRPKTINLTKK